MEKASSLARKRAASSASEDCLKCFISGDGIQLQVMSERLAKQEQLATRKQHIVSFPYTGFRKRHLHMHRYKEVRICKWISSEEAFQLAAFIKQPQLDVNWQSIPSTVIQDSVWRKRNPGWMIWVIGTEDVVFRWSASPNFSGTSYSISEGERILIKEWSQQHAEQIQLLDIWWTFSSSGSVHGNHAHWSGLAHSPWSDNGVRYFCLGTICRTGFLCYLSFELFSFLFNFFIWLLFNTLGYCVISLCFDTFIYKYMSHTSWGSDLWVWGTGVRSIMRE